jgi:hypothetical protein
MVPEGEPSARNPIKRNVEIEAGGKGNNNPLVPPQFPRRRIGTNGN